LSLTAAAAAFLSLVTPSSISAWSGFARTVALATTRIVGGERGGGASAAVAAAASNVDEIATAPTKIFSIAKNGITVVG